MCHIMDIKQLDIYRTVGVADKRSLWVLASALVLVEGARCCGGEEGEFAIVSGFLGCLLPLLWLRSRGPVGANWATVSMPLGKHSS